jgi:hypothetical protein
MLAIERTRQTCHTVRAFLKILFRGFLFYKVVSKIFETGAAIYAAVVVARSTGRW